MNPQETRETHDPAILATKRNEILDIPTNSMGSLQDARDNYLAAKGTNRSGLRSSWLGRRFNGPLPDVDAARQAYETQRNQFIQIEARRIIESGGAPGAPVTEATIDPDFRQRLAEQVGQLMVKEMQNLTVQEVTSNQRSWKHRLWGLWSRMPMLRGAIGLGLNAAMVAGAATGNVPLLSVAMGLKVAVGTVGFEGTFEGIQKGLQKINGDLRTLNNAQVLGMPVSEVDRRLAAFQESRILNRRDNLDPTEQLLWDRKRELLTEQIRGEFTTANVVNWKRTRQEASNQEPLIHASEGHRDAAAAESVNQESIRAAAELAKTAAVDEMNRQRALKDTAEAARSAAEADIIATGSVLMESTDPAGPAHGAYVKNGVAVADVENLAKDYIDAEREIARLRAVTPPHLTQISLNEAKRDNAYTALEPLTWNREIILAAYVEREQASLDIPARTAEKNSAEAARVAAEIEANNQDAILTAAVNEKAIKDRDAAYNEGQIGITRTEMENQNNITQDQAIIIYDILMGGAGRTGVAGRADIAARASGLLAGDNLNIAGETRMATERSRRKKRWMAALFASGVVNLAIPAINNYLNPDVASAAAPVTSVATNPAVVPTINVPTVNIPQSVGSGFFDQIVQIKEQGSNFWRSLNAAGLGNNWSNPVNGVTKEGVIKDMVIKMAQHNGHNISLVHLNDAFKVRDLLKPEDISIITKAMGTSDVNDYVKNVMPLFQSVINR